MILSEREALVVVGKMIVEDMAGLAQAGTSDASLLFMCFGQSLNRIFCVARRMSPSDVLQVKPSDMMQWFTDQPMPPGLPTNGNVIQLLEALRK